MGIRKKEHRKKVEKRNARIQHEKNLMNKLYREAMTVKLNELKEKMSNTEETETVEGEVVDTVVNEVANEETEG